MESQTATLIARYCDEFGLGMGIEGVRSECFHDGDIEVSFDGTGIAHDLVEHEDLSRIGSVHEEFDALGAIWYVRGSIGDLSRSGQGSEVEPYQHLAEDYRRMYQLVQETYATGGEYPIQPACDYELDLDEILEEARKLIVGEAEGEAHLVFLSDYLKQAQSGFRHGCNRMRAKWKDHGGRMAANYRFWNIEDAVAPLFHDLQHEDQQWFIEVSEYHEVTVTAGAYCIHCDVIFFDPRQETYCENCIDENDEEES